MSKEVPISTLLGIDIGWVQTRVSLFGIKDRRYGMVGSQKSQTTLDPTLDLGGGVVDALRKLEKQVNYALLDGLQKIIKASAVKSRGVQQVALTTTVGRWPRTVLMGLNEKGSLRAGSVLAESLPIDLVESFGMGALVEQTKMIEQLVHFHPEILILTGGEDGGDAGLMQNWIDVLRIYCRLLPLSLKPTILFAGNQALEASAKRHLEPLSRLRIAPNVQPVVGEVDLLPAQVALDQEIFRIWKKNSPSLAGLSFLANDNEGTTSFYLGRSVRWLARLGDSRQVNHYHDGVLAIDLGGGSTTISAARGDDAGTLLLPEFNGRFEVLDEDSIEYVRQWVGSEIEQKQIFDLLSPLGIFPGILPETRSELAVFQAMIRLRLQQALAKFAENHPWLDYDRHRGLRSCLKSMIISGDVFTQTPTKAHALLMLLDAIQPWGITTLVLDRHQLLPLMGIVGGLEPVLPVHILDSSAFETLATVISPVSNARVGKTILTLEVENQTGTLFSGEIKQGSLTRIALPTGNTATITLHPKRGTDIGMGEPGLGGSVEINGGGLGLVIDARGRPIKMVKEDEARVNQLQAWSQELGG